MIIDLGTARAGEAKEFEIEITDPLVVSYYATCNCTTVYQMDNKIKGHIVLERPGMNKEVGVSISTLTDKNKLKHYNYTIKISTL